MPATHRLAACSLLVFAAPVFARDIGSFDRTLNVKGPVDLEVATHSGRITVRPGNTATVQIHKLRATTGSGGIRISGVDDEVRAQTGSGGIELESLKGRVEARAGSGGIRGSALSGPITARTGSGGIRIE